MIIYTLQVPSVYEATASYNRVRLFKKGFEQLNVQAEIYPLIMRHVNFWGKIIFLVENFFKLLMLMGKLTKKDVLIIYGETYFTALYPLFKKLTNLVIERNEYPSFEINLDKSRTGYKNSLRNLHSYKYAELFITCSSYLERYYKHYTSNIFISPLIVKVEEYNNSLFVNAPPINEKYVAYCGYFGNNKDGIPILLEAFSIVSGNYPELKLVLIGFGPEKDINYFREIIKKKGIDGKVFFTGRLPHSEVSNWLSHASMLALARPNNKQAEGGIPSKVGEYLSSGVPCVLTKVGDLPLYLKDGFDCFLSKPDSVEAFAEKMVECFQSDTTQICINALNTVQQFDYMIQTESLLKELKKHFSICH